MVKIIDGKAISKTIREGLKKDIKKAGITPGLAVVLVGENPASQTYVNSKKKACEKVGIKNFDYTLPEKITEKELLNLVAKLNNQKDVHGILVQLPLPGHIDAEKVLNLIDPKKDVDGFHPVNMGKLLAGDKNAPRSCTPLGIMELIDSTGVEIKGKRAVVVGRSNIVGKPVAIMLLERHATVTVCHSRTQNLPDVVRSADIVVAAIGKPEFIKGDWIKKGAVVIDVGINRLADKKIVGDVDFEGASKNASWITPVPDGVGPMTIAMLLKNTLKASTSPQVYKSTGQQLKTCRPDDL